MAIVRLDRVKKVYDTGHVAVDDASFTIHCGELVVLVGPSGCGKTTTLRMIAGLEQVTSGTISIGGRVVNRVPPKDREVAMVFQNYALYPHMTVFDNMAFGLKLRRHSKKEIAERVSQAAEILGIGDILGRRPKQLSGGQQQRAAVGRAIVCKPQVFLFDEPLSNLDAKLRVQMRTEIAKLHRRLDATMVYVTHDQVEAMTLGDRIVVMHEGHIQQIDTPLALYNHPANTFVAGFIGNPSMNLVHGRISPDDGLRFESTTGDLSLPLQAAMGASLAEYAGKEVVLGIRPEDLYVAGSAYAPDGAIDVELQLALVEPMGNELFVYARLEETLFIARVSSRQLPSPGETICLLVDRAKLHFFDGESEMAIGPLDRR